ncbi:membrane protein [Flavimobilis soli]|uniref:Membrane protein n=1 Tax=Flavimobilis soli TaxID=442709 RepID=A0A2A9EG19_9MICO|nr:phage holin family protein [Flavimobilis soli]PFG37170.1 membrane protein [Flavimobilis soli]
MTDPLHGDGARTGASKNDEPSVGELFGRLTEHTTRLVRAEIALAKAELKAKLTKIGIGAGLLVAAGVLSLYALGKLFDAAALGLAEVVAPWLAFLIVGVVLLIIVGILAAVGAKALKAGTPPVPEKAIDNVKTDVEEIKKGLRR